MTQWLNGSQSDFLYLLPVNSNYSLCPKYLSPRLLMIQISLNTESIRFATLQAIRMPTTYKCPDRIYRSGQIFVIQLCVRIADRNWTCTSLYRHILISIDTRTKRLTSHAHALLCALTQVGLLVTYSISPTHWTRPQRPTSRLEGSLCATINGSSSYLTQNFICYAMLEKDPGFILLLAFKCKECVQKPI